MCKKASWRVRANPPYSKKKEERENLAQFMLGTWFSFVSHFHASIACCQLVTSEPVCIYSCLQRSWCRYSGLDIATDMMNVFDRRIFSFLFCVYSAWRHLVRGIRCRAGWKSAQKGNEIISFLHVPAMRERRKAVFLVCFYLFLLGWENFRSFQRSLWCFYLERNLRRLKLFLRFSGPIFLVWVGYHVFYGILIAT